MSKDDYTTTFTAAPSQPGDTTTALYAVSFADDADWKPGKFTFTESPEEMRRIALESTVIEDLLKRVAALEKLVGELARKKGKL